VLPQKASQLRGFFHFMPYLVYILHSASLDKFYVGYTGDNLEERVRRHLSNHKGFTASAKDWTVAHTEEYATKEAACNRELTIKAWKSKKIIKELVEKNTAPGTEHPDR